MPITPEINTTTDQSMARDCRATLIKMDLEEHGVCFHRDAEKTARLCVSLFEVATYDAALWMAAEQLYETFGQGLGSSSPLLQQSDAVRAKYVTAAVQAVTTWRFVMQGSGRCEEVAQAYADLQQHKGQLALNAPVRQATRDALLSPGTVACLETHRQAREARRS